MELFIVEYVKKRTVESNGAAQEPGRYQLVVIAESQEQAKEKIEKSMEKLNKYVHEGFTYELLGSPKAVDALTIHEVPGGTSIAGLWG